MTGNLKNPAGIGKRHVAIVDPHGDRRQVDNAAGFPHYRKRRVGQSQSLEPGADGVRRQANRIGPGDLHEDLSSDRRQNGKRDGRGPWAQCRHGLQRRRGHNLRAGRKDNAFHRGDGDPGPGKGARSDADGPTAHVSGRPTNGGESAIDQGQQRFPMRTRNPMPIVFNKFIAVIKGDGTNVSGALNGAPFHGRELRTVAQGTSDGTTRGLFAVRMRRNVRDVAASFGAPLPESST